MILMAMELQFPVIAAETNNYKGIAGVSGPLDVKVLPLQAGIL